MKAFAIISLICASLLLVKELIISLLNPSVEDSYKELVTFTFTGMYFATAILLLIIC